MLINLCGWDILNDAYATIHVQLGVTPLYGCDAE